MSNQNRQILGDDFRLATPTLHNLAVFKRGKGIGLSLCKPSAVLPRSHIHEGHVVWLYSGTERCSLVVRCGTSSDCRSCDSVASQAGQTLLLPYQGQLPQHLVD